MVYDVFISYRREGGLETAKLLFDYLERDGYKTFLDVDTLQNGNFDEELLKRIDECTDFIIILNKGVFDRCFEVSKEDDWLRIELDHALKQNKNIIPIMLKGFTGFPNNLPDDIAKVSRKNGPEYSVYFKTFYDILTKKFLNTPLPVTTKKEGQGILKVLPNHSCNVWVDGEFQTRAEANKFTRIYLNKGETFQLDFISVVNENDKVSKTVKMTDEPADILTVDLDSVVKKREEQEKIESEKENKRKQELERNRIVQELNNNMLFVQGGTFKMGATPEQGSDCYSDEKPAHQVTVSSFYIGKYQVTQAQWKVVMGSNPSNFEGDNLPVEQVSWDDVQEFIRKLNAQTGKKYRLPTEAEWEFAARGGIKSKGYKYSGSNTVDSVAWYKGNSEDKTHDAGKKQANELGLYDMSGNVWEWCSDWYNEDYYKTSPTANPTGPNTVSSRVLRGGSWISHAQRCRVSLRDFYTPGNRIDYIGFRLALIP